MSHKFLTGVKSLDFVAHGRVVILRNYRCTMGSCIVILKDERIPMLTDVGHNNLLDDIVSVVEPSDIPLAYLEFCPLPNRDAFTSIANVCDLGWRLVTLSRSTPNPLPPIMKIETL